ncbi:glycosyltransferase family 4 protein [uncultured Rikenella sp.]|uniref:glycosyltransferase family 4 protein n=1 Tax=uncultured Rikenella sp. TaxID=368003 RepID=UPI002613A700|nr:glycosyltransferase family 4 protein [uncultured Rikenella sp.]
MKICCIFNIAPLYREGIYRRMDADPELDFDFLAGEESTGGIALMDIRPLRGFRGYLHNVYRKGGKLVWQKGAIRKAFSKRYDAYILTGNPGIRSNWIIAAAARLLGRRVYLWSHGLHGDERGLRLRKNMWYFRLAGHLLLYGERSFRLLLERGYPAERMTVIYNSLDYDKQAAIRNRIGDRSFIRNYFGNDLPLLVFVGRLTAAKRLDMLIEALSILAAEGRVCNLVLIGDGPMRRELSENAERLGLADRIWFYGESYDDEMIGMFLYYGAACVSPGNVGLTAIHALTFGTPVVTHDDGNKQMPEYEAIEPGVTGSLFAEGDAADLARAICRWIELSPGEREAVRRACHAVISEKFNPERQMEILRSVFGRGEK